MIFTAELASVKFSGFVKDVNLGVNTLRIGECELTASSRIAWVRNELLHRDLHPRVADDDRSSGKMTPTSKVRYRKITTN